MQAAVTLIPRKFFFLESLRAVAVHKALCAVAGHVPRRIRAALREQAAVRPAPRPFCALRRAALTTRALVDPAVQPPAERAAAAADAAAAKAIRDDVTAGVIGYLQLEVQLDDLYE